MHLPRIALPPLLALGLVLAIRVAAADLAAAGGDFVDLLVRRDFTAALNRCDDTMKAALPGPKLRETWQTLQAQAGPFQKRLRTRTDRARGFDIVVVTCQFEKAALDVRVVFDAQQRVSGLFFAPAQAPPVPSPPPPYANTNAFREREVTIGRAPWILPGTLSTPVGQGPWPALVLVHGSGPHDRDESVGAQKPFRDLAWGLASRGVAVLRYEKRTHAHASALISEAARITLQEETIDDALAAVAFLRGDSGINPRRIFVLGHSLGGMAAPRIGQGDAAIAGLIILAGPTRPLEDLILEQTRYLIRRGGQEDAAARAKLAEVEAMVARVKQLTPAESSSSQVIFGAGPAYWLDLRSYQPVVAAEALAQPMLILQGGRDYQVTEADYRGWKQGLETASRVTCKLYPDLNHLFATGTGPSAPSEYEAPGHVAEGVVTDIAAWIDRHGL